MRRLFLTSKGRSFYLAGCVGILLILLAGCGGSSGASTSASSINAPLASQHMSSGQVQDAAKAASGGDIQKQKDAANLASPQDLIKTLNVTLSVNDTRKVADDIQAWITTTDPNAISAGADYEQPGASGDNAYNINLSFSVSATQYPQVYRYLRDYTAQKGGHLNTFHEAVQDVTGDYVDTQSRLKNLRVEQTRLQDLLSHAQALSDVLTIEQKLTDVEGSIEGYEAHLNTLTSQTTYYTVSISLQPTGIAAPAPAAPGWSLGSVFQGAFSASWAFAQSLLTLLVWLLAFSFYIIPVLLILWVVRKWRGRLVRPLVRAQTPKQ